MWHANRKGVSLQNSIYFCSLGATLQQAFSNNSKELMHANCISIKDRGLLILGPSGSGKSSLSLKLIALGGKLVADDKTILKRQEGSILASCPLALKGQIEARGIGVLQMPVVEVVKISLVVDLGAQTFERIPAFEKYSIFGLNIRLLSRSPLDAFPEAIYHLLLNSDLY